MNRNLDFEMSMIVNINMLHYISPIKFVSKDSENKIKIRNAVIGLIEKECLIAIDKKINKKNAENIKNSTFFTVVVNEDIEDRYVQLFFNEFRFFKNPYELFIYVATKRFCNTSNGFKSSYSRWGRLMNISDKTAIKKLEEAKQRNLINIGYGEHVTYNKQSVNIYTYNDLMDK